MQVVETHNEGLSRAYQVTILKADLADKLDIKLKSLAPKMNLKGFRPGKVPAAHIRKIYGRELMGEIIQETLNETTQKALEQNNLRPAAQPELKPVTDFEKVLLGEEDLTFSVEVEAMPDFTPVDITSLELERPVYEAPEDEINEALQKLFDQNRQYESKTGKTVKAASGDKLVIDFLGKIDDVAFEGGAAEKAELIIGSGQFIPGFEDQLIGAKKGAETKVNVTFPEDYGAAQLAGKAAVFDVTVHDILAPKDGTPDEEFAKGLGLEGIDKLKSLLANQINAQYSQASRFKLKRALLDILDEKHSFELPGRMLEAEFSGIWSQVENDKKEGQLSDEDMNKSEDELKSEYRAIAERRVRLGLVLAEIGQKEKVQVSDQEVQRAIMNEARNYPGQEKQVIQFYQQNNAALAQIRAPIYEEKVCDLIFTKAKITDKPVSKEEITKEDEA